MQRGPARTRFQDAGPVRAPDARARLRTPCAICARSQPFLSHAQEAPSALQQKGLLFVASRLFPDSSEDVGAWQPNMQALSCP